MSYDTYIGNKGYSILKSSLSIKEQHFIRKELNVRPLTGRNQPPAEPYPIYKESKNKFYLPYYFGLNHFGSPKENKNVQNDELVIDLKFNGTLRDHQIDVVNKYMEYIKQDDIYGGCFEIDCGMGKTVMALYIITMLKKKTFVVIHKNFLLQQWIERIKQYVPNARIGVIQGEKMDYKDKDIVLCMLQSTSMKPYPPEVFEDFGFMVVDEVHHISSRIFSRALPRSSGIYTLGLSATMNRKDGLSKVFHMYLGDIIVTLKNADQFVTVNKINYITDDEDFKEVPTDYKGTVAYSTLMTKISKNHDRCDFVVNIIEKILSNTNEQMIAFSEYKYPLTYIYDKIKQKNVCSVGMYVGGMKQKELEKSEKKQLILATYKMASEGLDIKTISLTLFISSIVDPEQASGRMLRIKHDNPTLYEIIDPHQTFQNHSLKRNKYYKSKKYKILETDDFNSGKWKTIYDPNIVVKQKTKEDRKTKKCDFSINK